MHNAIKPARPKIVLTAVASVVLAGTIAAGGIAIASESSATDESEDSSQVTITEEDVQEYCGMCHLTSVENDSISGFNKDTVDRAMVESMVPMLDDETIDALADYFAQIEPAEESDQNA